MASESDIVTRIESAIAKGGPIDLDGLLHGAQAELQRLKLTRLPVGRTLDPTAQLRFDREVAAGQTAPPDGWDKAKAFFGVKGAGNMAGDIARTARDAASGFTFGISDLFDPEGRAEERAHQAREKSTYGSTPAVNAGLDWAAQHGGDIAGMAYSMARGPLAAAGKGAQKILGMIGRQVPERFVPTVVGKAASRILGQGLAGGGFNAADAALRTATQGGSLSDVGDNALESGKFGFLLGTGVQAIPEVAMPLASKVVNSAGGKARALIEKYKGKVGPTTAGKGGIFDEAPDSPRGGLKGLEGNVGKGEAAQRSGARILEKADEAHRYGTQVPYEMSKHTIDEMAGQGQVGANDVMAALKQARNNTKLSVGQRGVLDAEIKNFENKYRVPDRAPRPAPTPTTPRVKAGGPEPSRLDTKYADSLTPSEPIRLDTRYASPLGDTSRIDTKYASELEPTPSDPVPEISVKAEYSPREPTLPNAPVVDVGGPGFDEWMEAAKAHYAKIPRVPDLRAGASRGEKQEWLRAMAAARASVPPLPGPPGYRPPANDAPPERHHYVDADYTPAGQRALPGMPGHEPTIPGAQMEPPTNPEGTTQVDPEISLTGPSPSPTSPDLTMPPGRRPPGRHPRQPAAPPATPRSRERPVGPQYVMTHQELNDYKTMLQGLSKVGQAGQHTIPEAIVGDVAALVKGKVDLGPYGKLNLRYHEGMLDRSDLRRGLGLGPKTGKNSLAEENAVRNVLVRQGQDTVTAGATTMNLPQLKLRHPELLRDIEMPEVLQARDDLGFHVGNPTHGGLLNQIGHNGLGASLMGAGLGAGVGALTGDHSGAGAAMGGLAGLLHHNATPIAGRLLYGPARALLARQAGGRMPAFIPGIEQAYAEALAHRRRADADDSETAFRGHAARESQKAKAKRKEVHKK